MASAISQTVSLGTQCPSYVQGFCMDGWIHGNSSEIQARSCPLVGHGTLEATTARSRKFIYISSHRKFPTYWHPGSHVKGDFGSGISSLSAVLPLQALTTRGRIRQRSPNRAHRRSLRARSSGTSEDVAAASLPDAAPSPASLAPRGEQTESWVVRIAVDGLTELLRILGVGRSQGTAQTDDVADSSSASLGAATAAALDLDILDAIRADYEERAYFLTGDITDRIYVDDCYFGDPTVKFTGREKWKRNIRLLVPFFEEPSISLKDIQRVEEGERGLIITRWRLRTYLRFPWRPLIDIDGSTAHTLDETRTKVVRHVESWEVSGLEAIGQMFVASDKAVWRRQS